MQRAHGPQEGNAPEGRGLEPKLLAMPHSGNMILVSDPTRWDSVSSQVMEKPPTTFKG